MYQINTTVSDPDNDPTSQTVWNISLQACFNNAPCPILTIVDTDKKAIVSSGTTPPENFTVGEQVNLQASTQSGTGTITNPQWIIPGNTVKNYTRVASQNAANGQVTTTTSGELTPLQSSDLSNPTLSFYWIDGSYSGTSQPVQLSALVNGIPQNVTANLNVLKPQVNAFTITTSQVSLIWNNNTGELLAGTVAGQNGSTWHAEVQSPPSADPGQIAFTQLASVSITGLQDGGVVGVIENPDGVPGLDWKNTAAPPALSPPPADGTYDSPVVIGAGATGTLDDVDSPFEVLKVQPSGSAYQVKTQDNFSLYLMYKPTVQNKSTIWVTLNMATWGWNAVADWAANGTAWTLEPGASVTPAGQSSGQGSTVLPVWSLPAPHP
ncbi:MAG: hypothetical protein ABSD98_05640 [Candidatus Korobacteraceae bacterium]